MSKESSLWLNTKTLIGFVLKRGRAWHYRAEDQGSESNHYDGAIPVEDVRRRLFNFSVVEAPLYIPASAGQSADEVGAVIVPGHKAMVTSDTNEVLGIHSGDAGGDRGYKGHDYTTWLLDGPANLVDQSSGDLAIGSAGLLRNRAVAWVSIEVPENIVTPEGVEFRPNLLATTSFDGSLATTYKRVIQNVVCDNTLEAGLGEAGQQFKLKHTRYSTLKLADARDALSLIYSAADDFTAEVAALCATKVTGPQFRQFLDIVVPIPVDEGRGRTLAEHKQSELMTLWLRDERVAPWQGTAFGVLQAFNTWGHHKQTVRNTHRAQRNMLRAITGEQGAADREVMSVLGDFLASV